MGARVPVHSQNLFSDHFLGMIKDGKAEPALLQSIKRTVFTDNLYRFYQHPRVKVELIPRMVKEAFGNIR